MDTIPAMRPCFETVPADKTDSGAEEYVMGYAIDLPCSEQQDHGFRLIVFDSFAEWVAGYDTTTYDTVFDKQELPTQELHPAPDRILKALQTKRPDVTPAKRRAHIWKLVSDSTCLLGDEKETLLQRLEEQVPLSADLPDQATALNAWLSDLKKQVNANIATQACEEKKGKAKELVAAVDANLWLKNVEGGLPASGKYDNVQ